MTLNETADLRETYVRALREYTDARAKIAQCLIDGTDPTDTERGLADDARVILQAARSAYVAGGRGQ